MFLYVVAWTIYQILILAATPFFLLFFFFHDEAATSATLQRLGFKPGIRQYKYWCHVASVGEFNALQQLIKHLPKDEVFITVMNAQAYKSICKLYAPEQVAYSPIDNFLSSCLFIFRLKPDVFLGVESEVWPCQLFLLRVFKVQSYLVNAGLSQRSLNTYRKFPKMFRTKNF